ncbi:hypothetical protein CLV58_13118 [Spirosoma oryzae]|uniref:Uncharacterized protein n=1 Tax=Spirosoma oryzae TaxID=1469603 RepID=A0A2T0S316_9BACT|nr:hypothetical protein [Spirosoma oryzae]PRY27800.1 hypothetical protein CLV58_13118 [Spirosoma oryzae]
MEESQFDYDGVNESTALTTGSLVSLIEPLAGNAAGSRGVVYHYEVDNGISYVSVLLANGHDIGAFAPGEAETSLSCTGIRPLDYVYVSPAQLQQDYAAGVFAPYFEE